MLMKLIKEEWFLVAFIQNLQTINEREMLQRGRSSVPSPLFNIKKNKFNQKQKQKQRKVYF
jgi:hypothetical protein